MTAIATPPIPQTPPTIDFGTPLFSTPDRRAQIERGEHQVTNVDGHDLKFPSNNLPIIETADAGLDRLPPSPTSHTIQRHMGQDLEAMVHRLAMEPDAFGAGGFTNLAVAQSAVDKTIAAPQNQEAIGKWMHDPTSDRLTLDHLALGHTGESIIRPQYDRDLAAAHLKTEDLVAEIKQNGTLSPATLANFHPDVNNSAHVDLIKDSTMATAGQDPNVTGFRVRTAWPDMLDSAPLTNKAPLPDAEHVARMTASLAAWATPAAAPAHDIVA